MDTIIGAIVVVFALAVAFSAAGPLYWKLGKKQAFDDCDTNDGVSRAGIVFGCIALSLALVIAVLSFFAVDEAHSAAASQESALSAQAVRVQSVLSYYDTAFSEQLGIANLQSSKIQSMIIASVAGQQNLNDFVNPSKSALYAALVEAYPQVTLSQYQNLIAFIQQGRQAFQNAQSTLLTDIQKFEAWQHSGFLIHPFLVDLTGAPNHDLHLTIGGNTLYGQAALNWLMKGLNNPQAAQSIATGTLEPLVGSNG